jgi:predicted ATP-dependent endonuclease of OLD family
MRIKKLRIQNFRSFKDTTLDLDSYNCLVGPNGTGKSSVLIALNVFFREATNPTDVNELREEDFHLKNTNEPIVITVTFGDLSREAGEDLQAYVRHKQLVVSAKATWDEERRRAEVKQYGSRLVLEDFAEFFEAEKEGKLVPRLREIYQALMEKYPDLAKVKTKPDMTSALREYEESHEELCTLQESSDQFYGWSRGANRLAPHCQWIFIPAVKDASEEELETRASALGQLLQRTIRSKVDFAPELQSMKADFEARYLDLIGNHQELLATLSSNLEGRLSEWAHPGVHVKLKWHFDESKSVVVNEPLAKVAVGEGPFTGELARLGHGIQRSFIVALLQELAVSDNSEQPSLILGIEEPELYQHPPQAHHLSTLLQGLTEDEAAQVIVSTHSPYFVSGKGFESVRFTRKNSQTGVSTISALTHEKLSERLAKALKSDPVARSNVMAQVEQIMQPSQNELFFARVPILVEGPEDVAFISSHLHLFGHWEDFRRHGCHFIVCGGKNAMSRPLAIALGLGLEPFVVFDGDGSDEKNREKHEKDNGCILRLCDLNDQEIFPTETLWNSRLVMWHTQLRKEVSEDVGAETWGKACEQAFKRLGLSERLSQKNSLWIASTLEQLCQAEISSKTLERLCSNMLRYAERVAAPEITQ